MTCRIEVLRIEVEKDVVQQFEGKMLDCVVGVGRGRKGTRRQYHDTGQRSVGISERGEWSQKRDNGEGKTKRGTFSSWVDKLAEPGLVRRVRKRLRQSLAMGIMVIVSCWRVAVFRWNQLNLCDLGGCVGRKHTGAKATKGRRGTVEMTG